MQEAIILRHSPAAWLEGSISSALTFRVGGTFQRRRFAPTRSAAICASSALRPLAALEGYDLEAFGPGAVMRLSLGACQPAPVPPGPSFCGIVCSGTWPSSGGTRSRGVVLRYPPANFRHSTGETT